jgi:tetratricopeptide (TPR) repeat protein
LARADRRRDARTKPVAAGAERYQSAYVGTDQLFFQRLRKQAKWVFVFLAFIFAFTFVVFGVGSEVPGGVADIIQGGGGGGGADVGAAQERTQENPGEADAWRDLSTALQQDGRPEEAIAPLERFVALEPKDTEALGTLASLYLIKAGNLADRLRAAQQQAALDNPGQSFTLPSGSPFAQAFATNPVTDALVGDSNARVNDLYTRTTQAYQEAKLKYAQLAELQPDDASIQIQLAQAAENANDLPSAVAAYEQFLKLAPDDPSAEAVKARVEQLKAASQPTGG